MSLWDNRGLLCLESVWLLRRSCLISGEFECAWKWEAAARRRIRLLRKANSPPRDEVNVGVASDQRGLQIEIVRLNVR